MGEEGGLYSRDEMGKNLRVRRKALMKAPVILLPYDGNPFYLSAGTETAAISEEAAYNLRTFGIGLSNDYKSKQVTYAGYGKLNVQGALEAAREGRFTLSKKAQKLLEQSL
jgi:hypothetical protein